MPKNQVTVLPTKMSSVVKGKQEQMATQSNLPESVDEQLVAQMHIQPFACLCAVLVCHRFLGLQDSGGYTLFGRSLQMHLLFFAGDKCLLFSNYCIFKCQGFHEILPL